MDQYKFSNFIEAEVARMYNNEYHQPFYVVVGNFAEYDVVSNDEKVTIEVKLETTPQRTGNACIEFWNTASGRPSGILSTKANIWLHIVLNEGKLTAFEFDKNVLLKVFLFGDWQTKHNLNAKFKLIPLEEFRKHAKRSFEFKSAFEDKILAN